jgi:hypothetical protein
MNYHICEVDEIFREWRIDQLRDDDDDDETVVYEPKIGRNATVHMREWKEV